jgi:SAM-dependent methyltransferase
LYTVVQRLVGRGRAYPIVVQEHIRARTADRLLDIGCGPGDILRLLPDVDYVGFDVSAEYIEAARRTFGDRGEFHCVDVREASMKPGEFDVVLAMGVLHHLDDDGAHALLDLAERALRDGGRFVSVDPTLTPSQNPVARWLIRRDRGAHVRSPDGYQDLAASRFASVRLTIRTDLLRVPFTHAVMECTANRSGQGRVEGTDHHVELV